MSNTLSQDKIYENSKAYSWLVEAIHCSVLFVFFLFVFFLFCFFFGGGGGGGGGGGLMHKTKIDPEIEFSKVNFN